MQVGADLCADLAVLAQVSAWICADLFQLGALALALGCCCPVCCAVAGVAVGCKVRGAGSVIGMGGMVVVVMVSVGGQLPEIPAVKYAVCSVLCCVLYLLDNAAILGLFYSSRGILYAV